MVSLYQYQKDYLSHVKPNWIYDCDVGTGKTYLALMHSKMFFEGKPITVYAPASKVKEGGWQRTAEEFNLKIDIHSYHKLTTTNPYNNFLIFDEAHRIRNSVGVWGKHAYKITKNNHGFVLLSATPLSNGWIDVINYFKMFGEISNKSKFYARYVNLINFRGYPEITGYHHEDELMQIYKKHSRRLNNEDALDLPETVYKSVYFDKSVKYKQIKNQRKYNGVVYDNMMSWRHGLRANVSTKQKVEYILSLLEDVGNENVIIFYNYNEELHALKDVIQGKIIYECNGSVKNYPIGYDDSVKNSVTLANYKSGSEGVDFGYSNIIVLFSPSESFTEQYQALGRCQGLRQKKKLIVYKLITKKTIEEAIYKSTDNKQDFVFEVWVNG